MIFLSMSRSRRLAASALAAATVAAGVLLAAPDAHAADQGRHARAATGAHRTVNIGAEGWFDEQESPIHSFTKSQAVAQAKRFSVITALSTTYSRSEVAAMKRANPSLRILAYVNATMAQPAEKHALPPSWVIRDAKGRPITNNFGLYLMNPRQSGWATNRAKLCDQRVKGNGYDGCFLDNLGIGTIYPGLVSGKAINPATHRPYTSAQWLAAASRLTAAVRHRSHRSVSINGLVSGVSYFAPGAPSSVLLKHADIGLAETFIRTSSMGVRQYRPETAWQDDVDMLVDAAHRGKQVCVITKVWSNGSKGAKAADHAFALASFLLGTNGRQCFAFSSGRRARADHGDPLLMRMSHLGQPTAHYYATGGIFARRYTRGLVLVNPDTTSHRMVLPTGQYRNGATGRDVAHRSMVLGAHRGLMLFRR
jgi:hypothetical protein